MAPPNSNYWITDPEYIKLLNFLIAKTKNVKSPLNVTQLAGEFKEKNQSLLTKSGLRDRIFGLRNKIYAMEHIDEEVKVKILFALSARIDTDCLEKLKENADVTLDCHNRIIEYKTKGGEGLQLKGIHIRKIECEKAIKRDERMLEFFAQKSMNAITPINLTAFVEEFKTSTGATEHFAHLEKRFKFLKNKLHESADIDHKTKLRMLFASGANFPKSFLEILRKDALVEVDECNRIIKYEANDGSLYLSGDHSYAAKLKAGKVARRETNGVGRKSTDSDSDVESENDSDSNCSEEPETDSKNEDYLDETGESVEPDELNYEIPVRRRKPSKMEVEDEIDYDPSTGRFNKSEETEIKEIKKSQTDNRSMNSELDKEETQRAEEIVTTKIGRASQKKVSGFNSWMNDSDDNEEFSSRSYKMRSSAASTSVNPESAKMKRKTDSERSSSSKRAKPASDNSIRQDEMDGYDSNFSFHITEENPIEAQTGIRENVEEEKKKNKSSAASTSSKKKNSKTDTKGSSSSNLGKPSSQDYRPNQSTDDSPRVELKPFRGSILDKGLLNPMDADIQVLERPPAPANGEMTETPIKTENDFIPQQDDVPVKEENPVEEEVKLKFTSQLKLLEAMKSLVINLDLPSLSLLKSKICQKIWKIGESDKRISNEEMILAMEMLLARIANHSVPNLPRGVESFSLLQFLCYFKAAITNMNEKALNSLLEKIKERIKEQSSKDKSIPVETVASVLQTTLDFISF